VRRITERNTQGVRDTRRGVGSLQDRAKALGDITNRLTQRR
jgi:hypothetical protein